MPGTPATAGAGELVAGSGWQDLHAFAIANALDAAFTDLLLAPTINRAGRRRQR